MASSRPPASRPELKTPAQKPEADSFESDPQFWPRLLTWGGTALAILFALVLLRNLGSFRTPSSPNPSPVAQSSPQTAPSSESPRTQAPLAAPANAPAANPGRNQPSSATDAQPTNPLAAPQPPQDGNSSASATPDGSLLNPTVQPPRDPRLMPAFMALQQGDAPRALALLQKIPQDQQSPEYSTLLSQVSQVYHQGLLAASRQEIAKNQASWFSSAIKKAQAIPPSSSFYPQAQQDIDRWSAVILDLATGRARRGDFEGAISAARLVPPDRQGLRQQADQAIALWQQQAQQKKVNADILRQAESLIRFGQASSYNSAIFQAQKVPPGQPMYTNAQQNINIWSEEIYEIAVSRASRRRWRSAIEAAELIPPGTTAFPKAEQAIIKWKRSAGL